MRPTPYTVKVPSRSSIAGAIMTKPITFQTPAPLYNGFPEGSFGVRGWLHAPLTKMCATPASDKNVCYIKLL